MSVAHCTVTGAGTGQALAGVASSFDLTLREDANQSLTVPMATVLPLVAVHWLAGPAGDVVDEAAMQATGLTVVPASSGAAGVATVRYTWPQGTAAGPRRLRVTVCGVTIPSSPFTVQVVTRGCDEACTEDHPGATCFGCGTSWDEHSDHTCEGGARGSFPA